MCEVDEKVYKSIKMPLSALLIMSEELILTRDSSINEVPYVQMCRLERRASQNDTELNK